MAAVTPVLNGRGVPESAWRQSPWLRALPRCSPAQWLAGVDRLVLVSPHPDDEVLGCGGLLHHAARAGIAVRVIAVTDGEACYPQHLHWTPARLRRERPRELAAALLALGLQEDVVQRLQIPDGAVREHSGSLEQALNRQLRAGDRVLVPWLGDGHPDHGACAAAALRASPHIGVQVSQFPVWAWHWMPSEVRQPPLPEAVVCAIDAAAREAKRRALACFVSQRAHAALGATPPILPDHVMERFGRDFEVFCDARD